MSQNAVNKLLDTATENLGKNWWKNSTAEDIIEDLEVYHVCEKGTPYSTVVSMIQSWLDSPQITKQEIQYNINDVPGLSNDKRIMMITCCHKGYTSKEIADEMGLNMSTVRSYRSAMGITNDKIGRHKDIATIDINLVIEHAHDTSTKLWQAFLHFAKKAPEVPRDDDRKFTKDDDIELKEFCNSKYISLTRYAIKVGRSKIDIKRRIRELKL